MSRQNSPGKKQNSRHKGMRTSLMDQAVFEGNNKEFRLPQKAYVQTIIDNNTPHVLPYIDSGYNNQSTYVVNQVASQYIPSNYQIQRQQINGFNLQFPPRQNNHVFIRPPQTFQNVRMDRSNGPNIELGQRHQSKSKFVPAPPETFLVQNLYNTNTIPTNHSIHQNRNFSPSVNQTHSSVKKTFIPHHIYNEIPVYLTPVGSHQNHQNQVQPPQTQQNQQVLLGYYQKVYAKLQQQKQTNYQLRNKLLQMDQQLKRTRFQSSQPQFVPQPIIQKVVQTIQRRKTINLALLQKTILQRYQVMASNTILNRKINCMKRLARLFDETADKMKQTISITMISTEVQI